MPVTVLIVDDHAGFRGGAKDMLQAGGFLVIGEAATLESARESVALLRPDVVLLDIRLPDGRGFDLAIELSSRSWPKDARTPLSRSNSSSGRRR